MALDYAKAYQDFIDEEMKAGSMTEWMVGNTDKVEYSGGKDLPMCEITFNNGLGGYDAAKTDGSAFPPIIPINNKWRTYSLFMDRAAQFAFDNMFPSDSGYIVTAENAIREFTRTRIVPELDTYRITKLYNTVANGMCSATNLFSGTITKDNAVSELLKTLAADRKSVV